MLSLNLDIHRYWSQTVGSTFVSPPNGQNLKCGRRPMKQQKRSCSLKTKLDWIYGLQSLIVQNRMTRTAQPSISLSFCKPFPTLCSVYNCIALCVIMQYGTGDLNQHLGRKEDNRPTTPCNIQHSSTSKYPSESSERQFFADINVKVYHRRALISTFSPALPDCHTPKPLLVLGCRCRKGKHKYQKKVRIYVTGCSNITLNPKLQNFLLTLWGLPDEVLAAVH